ncbi:MAG: hypothetical protein AB7E47_13425 [Desulfovibrionaceae bacterium]
MKRIATLLCLVVFALTPACTQGKQPAPAPEPVAHDGLIIVVKGTGFHPALGQRIINERHELLFDPSMVLPELFADRVCGGYSASPDEAWGLLASWGSRKPLVISGVETATGTEVVISDEDAKAIMELDQKADIFSQARIVFLAHPGHGYFLTE